MDITIDQAGWASTAARYQIKARPDEKGNVFTPVSLGMHPDIKQLFGGPRGLVLHCTDVVVTNAASFARRTATTSPRKSAYTFLIGLAGDLHQLCSIFDRPWHAGRDPSAYAEIAAKGTLRGKKVSAGTVQKVKKVYSAQTKAWSWPVVGDRAVQNPNNWGPGIEIMGTPGLPAPAQQETLRALVAALLEHTPIQPDGVWRHGDLDPLHRKDPGFALADVLQEVLDWHARESDGWNAEGGPE